MQTFKMMVKQGDGASLFDEELVSEVNGEPSAGYVFTVYGEIADWDSLGNATTLEQREKHYLPLIENTTNGNTIAITCNRVNEAGYYQTSKLMYANSTLVEQVNVPISLGMYKHLTQAAINSYKFERFKFRVPDSNLVWEVDVFKGADGSRHPWIKCDIEVADLDSELPDLPIPLKERIIANMEDTTDAEVARINRLYKSEWLQTSMNWSFNRSNPE